MFRQICFKSAAIAQSVEHSTENARVAGSSPACGTILLKVAIGIFFAIAFFARATPIIDRDVVSSGDCIQISFDQDPSFCILRTVTPRGTISVPYFGEMMVAGRSIALLQVRLGELLEERLSTDSAQLQVTRVQSADQIISVSGRVQNAVEVRPRQGFTLKDLLKIAKPLPVGDLSAIVIQDISGKKRILSLAVDGKFLLRPGDAITVRALTTVQSVFVLGGVNNPGAVSFRIGITLKEVLAESGGMKPGRYQISLERRGQPAKTLDLAKDADLRLEPGDTISLKPQSL